jgi:hypothetical protein
MARLRFTNQIAAYATIVWPVDGFSSNGELCLNCLSHSRGQVQIGRLYSHGRSDSTPGALITVLAVSNPECGPLFSLPYAHYSLPARCHALQRRVAEQCSWLCFRQSCVVPPGTAWFRSGSPAPPSNASRQWPWQWMGRDQWQPVVTGELPLSDRASGAGVFRCHTLDFD